jgi:Zn-dependent metalloprotease
MIITKTLYIMRRHIVLFSVSTLFAATLVAQPSLQKLQATLQTEKQNTANSYYRIEMDGQLPFIGNVLFSPDNRISTASTSEWLKQKMAFRDAVDQLHRSKQTDSYFGTAITRYQQYFKGIKVMYGAVVETAISNQVASLQLEFYPVPDDTKITALLTEQTAFDKALEYVAAEQYVWQNNPLNLAEYQRPTGELVIVEDQLVNPGKMCLAYRFDVFATKPLSRQHIFIDAATGNLVFKTSILHHAERGQPAKNQVIAKVPRQFLFFNPIPKAAGVKAPLANAIGMADTRYSGRRAIITTASGALGFELLASGIGDNTSIQTMDMSTNTDFSGVNQLYDDDNNWTAAEYSNSLYQDAGMEAHWGEEKVVKYWWERHFRKSYDNNNTMMKGYVHFGSNVDNAFWNGNAMQYGDGSANPPNGCNPWASLDLCGHEIGHAICQATSGLIYARESGALNEGFSDIWGACVENYMKDTIVKKPFDLFEDIVLPQRAKPYVRSMENPPTDIWNSAGTYLKTPQWRDATTIGCPVPNDVANDYCGVHTNSGVMNKWFYLVTKGGSGTNGNNFAYNVTGLGFDKTERIAFLAEQMLTPNSTFGAARTATLNAVNILASAPNTLGITFGDTSNVVAAWNAVGVGDSIFTMVNTPVFASNSFTSIAVGKWGYIWAGTANNGFYKYNGTVWQKAPNLTNHNISQILPDKEGGIWIAQFGRTGAQAILGGIGYYADSSFNYVQYSESDGLPTRNVRGVFINNELDVLPAQKLRRVWGSCFADLTVGLSRPGSVVIGKEVPVPPISFTKQKNGVNQNNGFCLGISGNKNEVWVFASSNSTTGGGQILRYRTADTAYLGFYDNTNTSLPLGFNVKAIYYDSVYKNWWVGLTTGGIFIYSTLSSTWTNINFPAIFPAGTTINNNAITGDIRGNIYIGTNNGYAVVGDPLGGTPTNPYSEADYKLYTKANAGLPNNNVKGLALDYNANRLLIATDGGIMFKYSLCRNCIGGNNATTATAGPWHDPTTWSAQAVPNLLTNVVIKHNITINANAECKSLKIVAPGNVTVAPGVEFKVSNVSYLLTPTPL